MSVFRELVGLLLCDVLCPERIQLDELKLLPNTKRGTLEPRALSLFTGSDHTQLLACSNPHIPRAAYCSFYKQTERTFYTPLHLDLTFS